MKKAIILLLILSACQFFPTERAEYPTFERYTGTEGVEVTIPKHPTNIYDGQFVDITIQLKNKGAHDIIDGIYNLITERQYMEILSWNQDIGGQRSTNENKYSLQGKTKTNPIGQEARISYRIRNRGLPSQTEHYNTPIIFQTCYLYKTFAAAPVCIDRDFFNENPQKPCTPGTETLSGGQGAPVAVTSVKSIMLPLEEERVFTGEPYAQVEKAIMPFFEITIKNFGDGQIIESGSREQFCTSGELDYENKKQYLNLVKVNATIQEQQLVCNNQEPGTSIRLMPDETVLRCRLKEGEQLFAPAATFISLMQIQLEYDYTTTAATTLDITKI